MCDWPGELLSSVKTLLNWLFRASAFSISSLIIVPLTTRLFIGLHSSVCFASGWRFATCNEWPVVSEQCTVR